MKRLIATGLCLTFALSLGFTTGCKKMKKNGADGKNPYVTATSDMLDMDELGMGLDRFDVAGMTPVEGSFESVYFEYDSSRVSSGERAKIDPVASMLQGDPNLRLVVEGNCDERGSREYNLSLGERRALSVREYLAGLGVDPSRIQTASFGEENPAAMGHDESSYRLNRRAEFKLFR